MHRRIVPLTDTWLERLSRLKSPKNFLMVTGFFYWLLRQATSSQVFRYAVATGRAERDPSGDLRGAIHPASGKHMATITDPKEIVGLLRDAQKVIEAPSISLRPADFGFFFVNPEQPFSGGTGHTIRVCQEKKVPIYTQDEWGGWV